MLAAPLGRLHTPVSGGGLFPHLHPRTRITRGRSSSAPLMVRVNVERGAHLLGRFHAKLTMPVLAFLEFADGIPLASPPAARQIFALSS
jgi:hypothetical protein